MQDARKPGESSDSVQPNYNVAPTNRVPVIIERDGEWVMEQMELGLVPSNIEELDRRIRPLNARADRVLNNRYFRYAVRQRRCLVPMSGYYEWAKTGPGGKTRLPYYIHRKDREPFYIAGIWEEYQRLLTVATLTVPANEMLLSLPHDRMVAILSPEEAQEWMDPATPAVRAACLLKPYTGDELTMHRVSVRVNKTDVNDERCIEPCDDQPGRVKKPAKKQKHQQQDEQKSLFEFDNE